MKHWIALVVFLLPSVLAVPVLEVRVQQEGERYTIFALVVEGSTPFENSEGPYTLLAVDSKEVVYARKGFYLPRPVDHAPQRIRSTQVLLPYDPSVREIVLLHEGVELARISLELCTRDGTCAPSETELSCPVDCPAAGQDGLCVGMHEGVCDVDCLPEWDIDCVTIAARMPEATAQGVSWRKFAGVALLLLSVSLFFYAFVRRKA